MRYLALVALLVPLLVSSARADSSAGVATLRPSGAVAWRVHATEDRIAHDYAWLSPTGRLDHVVHLAGETDRKGDVARITVRIDDFEISYDPTLRREVRDASGALAVVRGATPWLEAAVLAMPDGAARDRLDSLASSLRRAEPRYGLGDCYAECMRDERRRCYEDCHSTSSLHPCVSSCFIGVAIGCSIGCL